MNATSWLQGLRTQEGLRALGVRAPQYVALALAFALAAQAAVIVTDLAGSGRRPGPQAGGPEGSLAAGRRNAVDIAGLVGAHLFGSAPASGAGAVDPSHAPATSMSLVLAGVLAADDPSRGLAILGQAANNAKVYAVGQNLPGGATLHAVYEDRVILDRNGSLESLMLPHGAGGRGAPPPAVLAAAAPPENPLLDKMRNLIQSDPGVVGEVLRPQPVFTDGKMNGYRVYPGRNRAAFSHLGLQAGDLITSINGTPLDDPSRGNEIFRTLGSSSEARVGVLRNGRAQDLVLNLAQVANDAQQTLGAADSGSRATGTGNVAPPGAAVAGGGAAGAAAGPGPAPALAPVAAPAPPAPAPAPANGPAE